MRRLVLAGAPCCAALATGAASAFAATASTPYQLEDIAAPDPEYRARFPERLTAARDLDGDGVGDVFASTYALDVNGVKNVGRVYLFSGATRNLIRRLEAPDQQAGANFGMYISVVGDVNRDGFEDLAVGASGLDVDGNARQGRLYVFNGRTGSLIHRIDNPEPQAGASFAGRVGAAGDVNGDGVADIIVGATGQDIPVGRKDAGKAFVFSGLDASLLREYEIPEGDVDCTVSGVHDSDVSCGNLGFSPQVIGDLDGDGVPDHMVAASTLRPTHDRQGRIYVFSGADGEALARIDQPEPDPSALLGLQDTDRLTPGDLNGDGVPEIYGSAFQQDADGMESAGRAWVFDGAHSLRTGRGELLYDLQDPNPSARKFFGFTVSQTDYNKDATPDLYVSNLTNHDDRRPVPQESYVFDGRDGSLLKTLALPASEPESTGGDDTGNGFGWSSRAPGDLNGDGEPDYVAAAPFQDVGGVHDAGELYFFLSDAPPAPPAHPAPPFLPLRPILVLSRGLGAIRTGPSCARTGSLE